MKTAQESKRVAAKKLEGFGDLTNTLISDMKTQNFEFAMLFFGLALVQYSPTFLLFGMVTNILCHCILEICNLLFFFTLILHGVTVKRLL